MPAISTVKYVQVTGGKGTTYCFHLRMKLEDPGSKEGLANVISLSMLLCNRKKT